MISHDRMESIALACLWRGAACDHDELHTSREACGILPADERLPLVTAHDPEKSGGGKTPRHRLGGGIRIGGTGGLADFQVIDAGPWQGRGGAAEHFETVFRTGRTASRFMG